MTYYPVANPYQLFTDADGRPLEDGYIYIGKVNLNPITNPITVYWDDAGLYPAAQPIRTEGGYPQRNGSPGNIYNLDNFYSIIVKDKRFRTVFYTPNASRKFLYDGSVDAAFFGVKDGEDCTVEIQAALNYLDGIGGGELRFDRGTFYISADIVLPNTPIDPLNPNNNVPSFVISGCSDATIFKPLADNLKMFKLPGGAAAKSSNIIFERIKIDGDGQSNIIGIYLSDFYYKSSVVECEIINCDTVGLQLEYNGGALDCNAFLIDKCLISKNGVNFKAEDVTASYRLYGITARNTTFQLATGATIAGIGIEYIGIKDSVFINCVSQSNGLSGGTYGWGYALKMISCRHIYSSGKTHFEDHDQDANAYDLYITGVSGNYSRNIRIVGSIKRANLTFCKDTILEGQNFYTITDDQTAKYTVISHRDTDPQEIDRDERNQTLTISGDDNQSQGRVWNDYYGRIVDQRSKSSPWHSCGILSNKCTDTAYPANTAAWAVTGATKAGGARQGPHGLTSYAVTDLTATIGQGRISHAADTTWDGWKVLTVWLKRVSGSGIVRLRLRDGSSEVVAGYCTITDNWQPYHVCGYSIDASAPTIWIELNTNGDVVSFWNPILKDGTVPGAGLLNWSSPSAAIDPIEGAVFPGGAYFGWERVGEVYHGVYANWSPGAIASPGQATVTRAVGFASLGDFVQAAADCDLSTLSICAYVTTAGTVRIILSNLSGAPITPNAGNPFNVYLRVWARR